MPVLYVRMEHAGSNITSLTICMFIDGAGWSKYNITECTKITYGARWSKYDINFLLEDEICGVSKRILAFTVGVTSNRPRQKEEDSNMWELANFYEIVMALSRC